MPDALDELLAKIQREHGPRAIYRPPAIVPAGKWTSGLEARCKNERDDDDTGTIGSNGGIDGPSDGRRSQPAGAEDKQSEAQRAANAMVAAEAPPPVPGHLADGERSPEVDPYSPDPRLYPPEWLAELDRRCAEAVAEMNAAIERASDGR